MLLQTAKYLAAIMMIHSKARVRDLYGQICFIGKFHSLYCLRKLRQCRESTW